MSRGLLRNLAALVSGAIFGLGLSLAQMTNPDKVLNFLDMTGAWDPSLLLVLGGAVVLSTIAFHFVFKRPAPLWDSMFHLPLLKAIDRPLIMGSALFGVGWGLGGFCPGPALASVLTGSQDAVIFSIAMVAGMVLTKRFSR